MGKLKIMGKQKPPGDIPPGVFCFLTVRYTGCVKSPGTTFGACTEPHVNVTKILFYAYK